MSELTPSDVDRRGFLLRVVPLCSLACLAARDVLPQAAATTGGARDEAVHKFDVESSIMTSPRRRVSLQYGSLIGFIKVLQTQLEEEELIRLLNLYSTDAGRKVGARQAQAAGDTTFTTFVAAFRPPSYADTLSHEIVTDTEKVFELRVRECVWASVFRDAGLGGAIGHAAICNMDYAWPQAFNRHFRMVRTTTLMQGHDCCNHRYLDTT